MNYWLVGPPVIETTNCNWYLSLQSYTHIGGSNAA